MLWSVKGGWVLDEGDRRMIVYITTDCNEASRSVSLTLSDCDWVC
jgi:hypothetical protein